VNKNLPTKQVFKWEDNELKRMAHYEIEIEESGNQKFINKQLHTKLPHRTVQGIGKQRQLKRYKVILTSAREAHNDLVTCEDVPDVAFAPSPVSNRPFSVDMDEVQNRDSVNPIEEANFELPSGRRTASNKLGEALEASQRRDLSRTESIVKEYCKDRLSWNTCKEELSKEFSSGSGDACLRERPGYKSLPRGFNESRRNNRNTRRSGLFKKVQRSWDNDKSATIRKILDENFLLDEVQESPEIARIEEVYVNRLEERVTVDTSVDFKETWVSDPDVFGFITHDEIASIIKDVKRDTAAGVDKWDIPLLKKIPLNSLCLIFNKWWVSGIPDCEKECRTILLFKAGDPTEVGNWRPITIGNLLVRVFARVWDTRLRKKIILDERQKAFVPADGCFANVKTLQAAMKSSRKRGKELNVVFLDLAKAFDTVLHASIVKGLRRKLIPEEVIMLIMSMYDGASTSIKTRKGTTRKIDILNGVKQGCPLSPLLFNVVMDELLERIRISGNGVKLENETIGVMAFADDLVLLSETFSEMDHLLEICETFFDQKGLSINAAKCQSLRVLPVRGRKSRKVLIKPHRWWKGVAMKSLDYECLSKYLGVQFDPMGCIILPTAKWDHWIDLINKAPLKPHQKVFGLKIVIIPRMLYQLRLADVGIGKLKKLNRKIKQAVKKMLHLPEWTSDAWLHLQTGGNLNDILIAILKSRKKATEKMSVSDDRICAAIGRELDVINHENLRRIDLDFPVNSIKTEVDKNRLKDLGKITNGKALATMSNSFIKRNWLWNSKSVKGQTRIINIKMLSGTLPTRINLTRGRVSQQEKVCRRCRATAETDLHIFNECKFTKLMQMKRHNRICDKIAKELKNLRGHREVLRERRWRIDGKQAFQPDITVFENGIATFVEITVPYEKDKDTLREKEVVKEEKYRTLTPENLGLEGIESTKVVGIAIGSGGTIDERTHRKLLAMGLPPKISTHLQMQVMYGSAEVWHIFEKS